MKPLARTPNRFAPCSAHSDRANARAVCAMPRWCGARSAGIASRKATVRIRRPVHPTRIRPAPVEVLRIEECEL